MDARLFERVAALAREVAGADRTPHTVGPHTPLASGGFWLDSASLLELIVACETEFGTELDFDADLTLGNLRTVGTLAELIHRKRSA